MRADPEMTEDRVVRLDGLSGIDLPFDDQAEEMDVCELILGVVDLAAE